MTNQAFEPNWMSSPGATIVDVLEERGISIEGFAELMGYSVERVGKLISGRASITPAVAAMLEAKIGGSSRFWITREAQFRGDVARLQSNGDLAAARIWLSELPTQHMAKLGWITSESRVEAKVSACLRFFDVPNVSAWREKYRDTLAAVAFRASPAFEAQPGAVLAWLRYGHLKSMEIKCNGWDVEKFKKSLPKIRKLTCNKDPNSFVPKLRQICADCGVAVVIARVPSGCHASGATQFVSPNKAMILLSFRYLSDDQFWFTFFHEAGHLILHSKKALFLEDDSDVTSNEEDEANRFSESVLIPPAAKEELSSLSISKGEIIRFAVRLGTSRGIIVGQLQHMKRIKSDQLNWMKRRFNWDKIVH